MPIDPAFARREALFLLQEDLLAKIAETEVAEAALVQLAEGAEAKATAARPGSEEAYIAHTVALHGRSKALQLRQARLAMESNRHWYRNRLVDAIEE